MQFQTIQKVVGSKWIGIAAGVMSALCSGGMSFLVHSTSGRIPVTEITFCRSLLSLLAVWPFVLKESRDLFSKRAIELWFRSVASAISILCFAWNLQHTSIGFASILFNLTPLIVLVFGLVTGAISRSPKYVLAMGLVAVGSCLCFFGASIPPSGTVWFVGLLGATAAGASYTMLQRQSICWTTCSVIWPLSWMSLFAALILKKGPWVVPSTNVLYPLLMIGILGLATQFLVTVSLRHSGLALGTAIVPSSIGISVLLDAFTTHQIHAVALSGAFLYLAGIVPLVIYRSNAKELSGDSVSERSREVRHEECAVEWALLGEQLPFDARILRHTGTDHAVMAEIRNLRALCWSEVYGKGYTLEDGFDEQGDHWVVMTNGDVKAAARLTVHHSLKSVPDGHLFEHLRDAPITFPVGYISRLVVHPELRGLGLPAVLDRLRRDAASAAGCRGLVAVWNPMSGVKRKHQLIASGFVSLDGELPLADGGFGTSYVFVMPKIRVD